MLRNKVCEIFMKDNNGDYRSLFIIEGDKPDDPSLYIVKNIHINPQVSQTEEDMRNFGLQKTYHSNKDKNGLVDTHMKRAGKHFGKQKYKPINEVNLILHHHLNNDNVELYPKRKPKIHDILINSKPKYINDYSFIFYNNKDGVKKYLSKNKLILLHDYNIPLKYIGKLYLALVMRENRLIEIQSNK